MSIDHLKHSKEVMTGMKLEKMKTTDTRKRRAYTKLSVEELRLEVFQFDANMVVTSGAEPAAAGRAATGRADRRSRAS